MKISYKNTALRFLENPKDFPFHTPDEYNKPMTKAQDYKLLYGLMDQFSEPGFADNFKNNIQYVTQPFYEAYCKARPKLKEVVFDTELYESGTIIIPWPNHTQTFFYYIKTNGKKDSWDYDVFLTLFTKHPKHDSFGLDVLIFLDKDKSEQMDIVWKGFMDQGRDLSWWVVEIILFRTFLKYADVETKVVNGKKKENHIGVKYVNDTDRKIEILDSTYFTTISRTEGFGVRGHFRFQPYGIGMRERRLQWIDGFKKNGYTRTAKILKEA